MRHGVWRDVGGEREGRALCPDINSQQKEVSLISLKQFNGFQMVVN